MSGRLRPRGLFGGSRPPVRLPKPTPPPVPLHMRHGPWKPSNRDAPWPPFGRIASEEDLRELGRHLIQRADKVHLINDTGLLPSTIRELGKMLAGEVAETGLILTPHPHPSYGRKDATPLAQRAKANDMIRLGVLLEAHGMGEYGGQARAIHTVQMLEKKHGSVAPSERTLERAWAEKQRHDHKQAERQREVKAWEEKQEAKYEEQYAAYEVALEEWKGREARGGNSVGLINMFAFPPKS